VLPVLQVQIAVLAVASRRWLFFAELFKEGLRYVITKF
jgi:hypothetical protein